MAKGRFLPCDPQVVVPASLPWPCLSHRKKDWERKDWRWQEEQQLEPGASLDGFVSSGQDPGYVKRKRLRAEPGWDGRLPDRSIETALDEALGDDRRREAPGIWFVHCPPRHTVGDLTSRGERVGSVALRAAIERHAPMATFHGHIHESVDQHDGMFKEHITTMKDRCTVVSVGNDFRAEAPHVIVFDTDDPGNAVRMKCAKSPTDF